ncbi:hypothetical protein [Papillibacter cinnamivorans]|uniref:ABC-2 type transport system permease protein n=1 Tax=Papillibacter cinnamivorans DSM 12816 TaxID=1122930 RepID=A0A1W1ZYU0_9FIRM|nr:hypothetical protein [Papillibacter cinnamivorans]SMC53587.1 ABC-2 type transport system permease protein [Papillibacter cinnamivorans DSM 12816]
MRLKTSFFNRTVFTRSFFRFWPIWAIYTLIWAFLFPIALGNSLFSPYSTMTTDSLALASYIYRIIQYGGVIMTFVFGVVAAMAVFSYLYSPKSAGMMHALPIRREGLFFSNYLAGLCFFLIPHAVLFVLALLVEAGAGFVSPAPLLVWLGAVTAMAVFFYSFAVFCGMFTGNILALPVFYGVLSFLTPAIEYLIRSVLGDFLFGYSNRYSDFITLAFSPAAKLLTGLSPQAIYREGSGGVNGEVIGYIPGNWRFLVYYFAVALILIAAALFVYQIRRSESAGDLVSVRGMRPVFKFGVSACAALALGQMFYYFISSSIPSYAFFNPWILLLCMLLLGFVGYFASEMLLRKSFRVFGQSYKGFLIFSALLVLFTTALEYDFFGYERAVPSPESVQSVSLLPSSTFPYYTGQLLFEDQEEIRAAIALHGDIVETKASIEQSVREYYAGGADYSPKAAEYTSTNFYSGSESSLITLQILYTLTDGNTVRRQYTLPVTTGGLSDPDGFAGRLDELINSDGGVLSGLFPSGFSAEDLTGGTVGFSGGRQTTEISREQAMALYDAVMADRKENAIGRLYLLDNQEYYSAVYDNPIELYFSGVYPGWTYSSGKYESHSVTIWPETGSEHTIEALEKLGIVNPDSPLVVKGVSAGTEWNKKYYID